jgi:hypothetical protein
MAQSRPSSFAGERPLLGVKRTSASAILMSQNDPKQTSADSKPD